MKDLTKKAISTALRDLLLEKPINKISISDITEKAGVNRQTFYYHFRDIIDLLEWIFLEEEEKAIGDIKHFDTWQEAFLNIFMYFKKNKPYVMNLYKNIPLDMLNRYLYELVYPIIFSVVDEKSQEYIVNDDDIKFIVDFYMYAFVALVENWIKDGMEEDPKKIIDRLSILLKGTIDHSLTNLGKRKK